MKKIINIKVYKIRKHNSSILKICRSRILTSPENKIIIGNTLIGYEFDSKGRIIRYTLEGSIKNIASFVVSSPRHKLITSLDDFALLNTFGKHIDTCVDPNYLLCLIKLIRSPDFSYRGCFKFI